MPPPALFTYRGRRRAGQRATPATSVVVGFTTPASTSTWTWDAATGTLDASTCSAAGPDARRPARRSRRRTSSCSSSTTSGRRRAAQARGSEAEMVGSGDAWVFTGGKMVEGHVAARRRRRRPRSSSTPAATEIELTPGQTWVELSRTATPSRHGRRQRLSEAPARMAPYIARIETGVGRRSGASVDSATWPTSAPRVPPASSGASPRCCAAASSWTSSRRAGEDRRGRRRVGGDGARAGAGRHPARRRRRAHERSRR